MEKVKQINIKKSNILFFNDMINIKNFHSYLLTIDRKSYKEIDIFNIGYITIKKFGDWENIHSVNPFYLIFNSATGHFKEKNCEKYLIIDSIDKYEEVCLELDQKLKHLMVEKNCFMKKIMQELELILTMIYL